MSPVQLWVSAPSIQMGLVPVSEGLTPFFGGARKGHIPFEGLLPIEGVISVDFLSAAGVNV